MKKSWKKILRPSIILVSLLICSIGSVAHAEQASSSDCPLTAEMVRAQCHIPEAVPLVQSSGTFVSSGFSCYVNTKNTEGYPSPVLRYRLEDTTDQIIAGSRQEVSGVGKYAFSIRRPIDNDDRRLGRTDLGFVLYTTIENHIALIDSGGDNIEVQELDGTEYRYKPIGGGCNLEEVVQIARDIVLPALGVSIPRAQEAVMTEAIADTNFDSGAYVTGGNIRNQIIIFSLVGIFGVMMGIGYVVRMLRSSKEESQYPPALYSGRGNVRNGINFYLSWRNTFGTIKIFPDRIILNEIRIPVSKITHVVRKDVLIGSWITIEHTSSRMHYASIGSSKEKIATIFSILQTIPELRGKIEEK